MFSSKRPTGHKLQPRLLPTSSISRFSFFDHFLRKPFSIIVTLTDRHLDWLTCIEPRSLTWQETSRDKQRQDNTPYIHTIHIHMPYITIPHPPPLPPPPPQLHTFYLISPPYNVALLKRKEKKKKKRGTSCCGGLAVAGPAPGSSRLTLSANDLICSFKESHPSLHNQAIPAISTEYHRINQGLKPPPRMAMMEQSTTTATTITTTTGKMSFSATSCHVNQGAFVNIQWMWGCALYLYLCIYPESSVMSCLCVMVMVIVMFMSLVSGYLVCFCLGACRYDIYLYIYIYIYISEDSACTYKTSAVAPRGSIHIYIRVFFFNLLSFFKKFSCFFSILFLFYFSPCNYPSFFLSRMMWGA